MGRFILTAFFGVVLCSYITALSYEDLDDLEVIYQWREMQLAFPTEADKQAALDSGQYVPGNSQPIDVDVQYRCNHKDQGQRRVFVSIPRFIPGIPITLGVVTNIAGSNKPVVQAYPNYAMQATNSTSCDGITSVFRVKIDECNRLWVLDAGKVGSAQICPPQLLVFDMDTDALIYRYRIPAAQFNVLSLLVTPAVNVRDPDGTCEDTYVYMADALGFGMIVFSFLQQLSWRVTNKLLFPDPNFGTFTIAGESFDLMAGAFGLALSPNYNYEEDKSEPESCDRYLFFHSLAGNSENFVNTAVLNNNTAWAAGTVNPRDFKTLGRRRTQSAAEAMDRNGNLYFGLMNTIAIACWNIYKPYNAQNIRIIADNPKTLQFASGVKIITNCDGKEELWVLTNKFQSYTDKTLDDTKVNFRILAAMVEDLVPSGIC